MSAPEYVAGIFIANDYIFVDAAEAGSTIEFREERIRGDAGRFVATNDLVADLIRAIAYLNSSTASGFVRMIGVAIRGPIHPCGDPQPIGSAHIVVTHRSDGERHDVDLGEAFRRALKASSFEGVITDKTSIIAYSDACVYAIGDYRIARQFDPKGRRRSSENEYPPTNVLVHLTVDEGVSGAIVVNDALLHPRLQPEMGHIPIYPSQYEQEAFEPSCHAGHLHSDCFEAYVALPAIRKRWHVPSAVDIQFWQPDDDRLSLLASYVSQLCVSLTSAIAPAEISFSGRVMRNDTLMELTRQFTAKRLGMEYQDLPRPGFLAKGETYIRRRRKLNAGIFGCVLLAAAQ